MNRQKIMLFGYWEKNFGDDLFLEIFSEMNPNNSIYILSKKEYKKFYQKNNIKVITYNSLLYRLLNKILKKFKLPDLYYFFGANIADKIVFLGGSLFMEKGDWKRQVKNLNYSVKKCEVSYIIGSNFGPFQSKEFLELYSKLFKKMTNICFRDNYSYNLFSSLSNVNFAPDVVLNLKHKEKVERQSDNKGYYLFSIINLEKRTELFEYKEIYENKIIEIIIELQNNNEKILLMSFCDQEGDNEAILKIQRKLADLGRKVEVYSHIDIKKSLDIVINSKGILATRLHAMVLAFVYDIPVLPIIYSEKMKNIIQDYSFENEYIEISKIGDFNPSDAIVYLQKKPSIPKEVFDMALNQLNVFENK